MSSATTRVGERVIVFANPKAGSGAGRGRIQALCRMFEDRGFQTELIDQPEQLKSLTRSPEPGLRAVIAAGGDGTAELVANHTPNGTPLAVMPMGTENLLAKYLRLGQDPNQIVEMVVAGRLRQLDVGSVNGRLFLIMLSCGFDAEVVRRLHEVRSGNIHHFSYAKPILDAIRSYEYPPLRVCYRTDSERDGEPTDAWTEISANWVFVFNIPSYAIGLQIVPMASPFDGELDVATFGGGSFWHGLYHFSAVVLGQHNSLDDFAALRTSHLRIESDRQVPYQVDGDPGGFLPIEVRVLPQRLTMLVPEGFGGET